MSARNTAVWPFITVRDSLFNEYVCTPRTQVYIRSRVGPSLKSFSLTSRIYTVAEHIDIQHYCTVADALFSNVSFFPTHPPPSQHTASRPKAYTGITTTATGVIRRSWFSVSAYICTYANITQIVYTLVPAIIYLTYCYELLVVRPSTNADEINLLLSTY